MIAAEVIADSITPNGDRVTTMQVEFHRFVLAEFNTHRVFSRNSASSRAIPVEKQIKRILEDLALPCEWGTNQKGMQAGEPLGDFAAWRAERAWRRASRNAVRSAQKLAKLGVHKQVTNRLLEPFMWHTAIVTSSEWENFFSQRCSPLAQPEIRQVAECMQIVLDGSRPQVLQLGDWHLPYIQPDEAHLPLLDRIRISAARCARVSYLTQKGVRDIAEDLKLFERLTTAEPPHWSPLEHVCTPNLDVLQQTFHQYTPGEIPEYMIAQDPYSGNLSSNWLQLRHNLHMLEIMEGKWA